MSSSHDSDREPNPAIDRAREAAQRASVEWMLNEKDLDLDVRRPHSQAIADAAMRELLRSMVDHHWNWQTAVEMLKELGDGE